MHTKKFENSDSAVLTGADPDQVGDTILADTTPAEPVETNPAKKQTIGIVVAELVMDASLSYDMIVNLIHAQFEDASTSRRSVASVAARLRKDGIDVPLRRQQKGETA
jgi:hypothetical protein